MSKIYVLKIVEAIEELYDEFTNSGRNMGASRKKTRSQAIITHFFSLTHALHTTPMALIFCVRRFYLVARVLIS
jgi:hypothetical protein